MADAVIRYFSQGFFLPTCSKRERLQMKQLLQIFATNWIPFRFSLREGGDTLFHGLMDSSPDTPTFQFLLLLFFFYKKLTWRVTSEKLISPFSTIHLLPFCLNQLATVEFVSFPNLLISKQNLYFSSCPARSSAAFTASRIPRAVVANERDRRRRQRRRRRRTGRQRRRNQRIARIPVQLHFSVAESRAVSDVALRPVHAADQQHHGHRQHLRIGRPAALLGRRMGPQHPLLPRSPGKIVFPLN